MQFCVGTPVERTLPTSFTQNSQGSRPPGKQSILNCPGSRPLDKYSSRSTTMAKGLKVNSSRSMPPCRMSRLKASRQTILDQGLRWNHGSRPQGEQFSLDASMYTVKAQGLKVISRWSRPSGKQKGLRPKGKQSWIKTSRWIVKVQDLKENTPG